MWKFEAKQKRFQIGKVKIGGESGGHATVLIGSIFYHKQDILLDEAKGEFDKEKAEELIKIQEEFSDKTGSPHMRARFVRSSICVTQCAPHLPSLVLCPPMPVMPSSVDTLTQSNPHFSSLGASSRLSLGSARGISKQEAFTSVILT